MKSLHLLIFREKANAWYFECFDLHLLLSGVLRVGRADRSFALKVGTNLKLTADNETNLKLTADDEANLKFAADDETYQLRGFRHLDRGC